MLRRTAILLIFLASCSGSTPTEPRNASRCTTTAVFEREAFYIDRGEQEQEFRGTLEFRNLPATPNGRDHRYFLRDFPVYSGGLATEPVLRSAAGTTVTIRGKLVQFSHGPEIWPATVTSCR